MAALAGKRASVKIPSAAVAFTGEATTSVDSKNYVITNTAKRVWDPAVAVTVLVGGGAPGETYGIDRLSGTVIFAVANGSRGAVTVSGSYLPLSLALEAKSYSYNLTAKNDPDNAFGDDWVTRVQTQKDITGSLGRWFVDGYFRDALLNATLLVIQFFVDASSTPDLSCWALISRRGLNAIQNGLQEEMIDFTGTVDADLREVEWAGVTAVGPTLDELTFLRTNLSGGDTAIKGWYSMRYGVTSSGGVASAWDDARGTVGFGPSLAPTGSGGLSVIGSGDTQVLRSDSGRAMQTALSSLFRLPGPLSFVWVGVPKKVDNEYVACLECATLGDGFSGVYLGANDNSEAGEVGGFYQPGPHTIAPFNTARHQTAKRRVIAICRNTTTGTVDAPHGTVNTATIETAANVDARLRLGIATGGPISSTADHRAILIINRVLTSADLAVLAVWGNTYHGTATGAPKVGVAYGDSNTRGHLLADLSTAFNCQCFDDASFADWDDETIGTNGIQIGGTAPTLRSMRSSQLDPIFTHGQTTKVVIIVPSGNDIANARTGSQQLTDMLALADEIKAATAGVKVIGATMPARNATGSSVSQATMNAERATFNSGLLSGYSGHFDYIMPLAADAALSDYTNTTYYQTDGIHFKLAAHTIIKGYEKTAVLAVA